MVNYIYQLINYHVYKERYFEDGVSVRYKGAIFFYREGGPTFIDGLLPKWCSLCLREKILPIPVCTCDLHIELWPPP